MYLFWECLRKKTRPSEKSKYLEISKSDFFREKKNEISELKILPNCWYLLLSLLKVPDLPLGEGVDTHNRN